MKNTLTEKDNSCDNCVHKPKNGGYFRLECGECSRFYTDLYEKDKSKIKQSSDIIDSYWLYKP